MLVSLVSVFIKADYFFLLYIHHFYKFIFRQDLNVASLAWQIKHLFFNGKKNPKMLSYCSIVKEMFQLKGDWHQLI